MIKDGFLYYEGRRDTQIKVRGHRIDVIEVEKTINELNYVEKSAILVYHIMQIDQALVAFIIIKSSLSKTPADVEKDLKIRLAAYMIPIVLIFDIFPHLPNGKVDRQGLLKMYEEIVNLKSVKLEMEFKNIPTEKLVMAKRVFEIIGKSIGNELRNKVSVDANFFELGGNSINSVYTVTQLQSKGYFVGLTDFLNAENLGQLLDKVTTSKTPVNESMQIKSDMKLVIEPLCCSQQEECMQLLATSYINKSDLERSVPGLKAEHYIELLCGIWDLLIEKGFSFTVKNEKGELIGVSINFDVMDNPCPMPGKPLDAIFNFFYEIENPM